ncbi:hypothetical protein L7F22_045079 [Adiantum nelumboides]|nr:hypothetical protein [Adiantum nelumboides]
MGRAKLENVMLGSKSSRKECFNKRCRGVFKKVYELAHICGAGVRLIVEGEDGNIYHFHRRIRHSLLQNAIANDITIDDHSEQQLQYPTHQSYNPHDSLDNIGAMGRPPPHPSYNSTPAITYIDSNDDIPLSNLHCPIPGSTPPRYNNSCANNHAGSTSCTPSYAAANTSFESNPPAYSCASGSNYNYYNNAQDPYSSSCTPCSALSNGGNGSMGGTPSTTYNEDYGDNMQQLQQAVDQMSSRSNNMQMMGAVQALMLPPQLPSTRLSCRPTNRLMFYNGGRSMLETGVPVTSQLRRQLMDPLSCDCFDCSRGYSTRFFETINIDHSLPPLHGDDRPFYQKAPFMGSTYVSLQFYDMNSQYWPHLQPQNLSHHNALPQEYQHLDVKESTYNFSVNESTYGNLMLQGRTFQPPHDRDSKPLLMRTQGIPFNDNPPLALLSFQLDLTYVLPNNNIFLQGEQTEDSTHALAEENTQPIVHFPNHHDDPLDENYEFHCCCGKENCDDFVACLTNSLPDDEHLDFEASHQHVLDYTNPNIDNQCSQSVNFDAIVHPNFDTSRKYNDGDILDKDQDLDINVDKKEANTNVTTVLQQLKKGEILEEEEIDVLAKEKESANLDVAEFRAMTVIDEPTCDTNVSEASLTIPTKSCC